MKNKWHIVTIGHLTRNIYWGEDNSKVLHPCIATCSVVESEYGNILIDPSLPGEALAKELYDQTGIRAEDIAYTYSTHCHLDHWTGTEVFPNAKICMPKEDLAYLTEDRALYHGVRGQEIDRMVGISGELVPGFSLVPLPGHSLGLHGLLFDGPEGRNVVFTRNITESLNVLLKGFLKPGDHVITSSMEHNAVMRPLVQLEQQGVSFTRAACNPDGTLDPAALERALRPNTKAVVMTHGSNVCGTLLPIREVGAFCRAHGLRFFVDCAQTGGVYPISMAEMGIDALAFTGHKGLMGPQGTGGLCIRPGVELRPLLRGGTGIHSYDREQPQAYPARLEAGTLNTHGIAGLHAALKFIEKQTVQAIGAHERALMRRFYDGVKDIDGVTVYGDFSRSERAAVVALNIRDYDSAEVADALFADYDIATRAGAHCAPRMHEALGTVQQGAVRFSFSYFNTETEVDTAIAAVRELAE